MFCLYPQKGNSGVFLTMLFNISASGDFNARCGLNYQWKPKISLIQYGDDWAQYPQPTLLLKRLWSICIYKHNVIIIDK